jgi:hypothetical protein
MSCTSGKPLHFPSTLEQLIALEKIKALKARYCRFVDTKAWDRLRQLFTENARFEGLGSAPLGANLSTFIEGITARFLEATSVHHCHTPEIAFVRADVARGIWAMEDYVQWPPNFEVREVPGHPGFFGYGHYEEEYVETAGEWRISFLRLTRIRFDALPHNHAGPRPGRLQISRDWI